MAVKRSCTLSSHDKVAIITADLPDTWSADRGQVQSQKSADGVSGTRRLGLDSKSASEGPQELPADNDQNEIIEKIRTFMIKLVTSLNREAFRGTWRDQWLKKKMRETVETIESGSLKDMCKVFLKVELEMNWKALSDEFSKNRTRVLDAFGKCSATSDVYRELVFFSRELNPNFLHGGCELPSVATHEMLKLNELSILIKNERREVVNANSVDINDSITQQDNLDAARPQQSRLSPSKVPGKNDVAISEENETKTIFDDNRGPERTNDLDSTLVWALYRKKEWWPAQVIHFDGCQ